jgi:hypothetical protein
MSPWEACFSGVSLIEHSFQTDSNTEQPARRTRRQILALNRTNNTLSQIL